MPWKQVWVPNPTNKTLKVHKELPPGFKASEWGRPTTAHIPAASLVKDKQAGKKPDFRWFYECAYCKGWIEGRPSQYEESNLGPLCGRRGTVYSCIRCGHELGFEGIMS